MPTWLEHLFKFRPVQFAEGDFGLQVGAVWLVALLVAVLLAGLVWTLLRSPVFRTNRDRIISLSLRALAVLLLAIPLFEPVLITPDVVPDENFVAVLVDVSDSMTIPDGDLGTTRLDDALHLLTDEEASFVPGIDELFQVRYYTYGESVARVDSVQRDAGTASRSELTAALERVMQDFAGVPLAGVVLLSDGGDTSENLPVNAAEELRSLGVPLHVVGLGQPAFAQEREILEVDVSRSVEQTTGVEIDVKVRSWGAEASPVPFKIYDGETLLHEEVRPLKGEGRVDQFTLFFEPTIADAREYRLEVEAASNEVNLVNNQFDMLVDARQDTMRVLFFEGQLRREFKFVKRALEDDQVIEFTSVARTGTGKFYRQGIRSPSELAGGFPRDAAELFTYHAVLIGDFEAAAFTPERMALLESFVRIRGGGFAMLGGRNSFAEGNYWDTPIADLLPITLDPSRRMVLPPSFTDPDPERGPSEQGFRFEPTAAGLASSMLKLAPDPATNRTRWATMPGLTSINYLGPVKPGATVLAEKPNDQFGDREPLFVTQRYGKGRTAALATASTWRWQMHLPATDTRQERFWRQLARWLVADAPDRVNLDFGAQRFAPQETVPVRVEVYDSAYVALEGADVQLTLTDPSGVTQTLSVPAELAESGVYTTTVTPQTEGLYTVDVTTMYDGAVLDGQQQRFLVRPTRQEFYDATQKREALERLASTANGTYYTPDLAASIADNLRDRRTSTSIYEVEYLWDMPFLFGLVLLVLSAEWLYRRRRGLA